MQIGVSLVPSTLSVAFWAVVEGDEERVRKGR